MSFKIGERVKVVKNPFKEIVGATGTISWTSPEGAWYGINVDPNQFSESMIDFLKNCEFRWDDLERIDIDATRRDLGLE